VLLIGKLTHRAFADPTPLHYSKIVIHLHACTSTHYSRDQREEKWRVETGGLALLSRLVSVALTQW